MIAFKKNEFDIAIDRFKKILKEDQSDRACNYYIARSYEMLGNDILAKEYYENAIKTYPSLLVSYIDYSKYLMNKKEYAEAQRKLRKALKVEGENLEVLNMLFFVSYILVKDNLCEYNVKEVIALADKINSINPQSFEYEKERAELSDILKNL